MKNKPINRLLFMQGGLCFFCEKPLAQTDASVEHLVASANGGSNREDNCVACCKSLNQLLGSMSLKEKMQVVLNQKGDFKCPNGVPATPTPGKTAKPKPAKAKPAKTPSRAALNDKYSHVLQNLKQRGSAKPRTVLKLKNSIGSLFQKKLSNDDLDALVQQLQSNGEISIAGSRITYA